MDFTEIIEEVKSGIIHLLFLNADGSKINSGSGFLANRRLVTCDHVVSQSYHPDTKVHIRFGDDAKKNLSEDIIFGINELKRKIELKSPENENDFCVLNISEIDYGKRYNFRIATTGEDTKVGIEILLMGYPFDHLNLVSHRGFISSIYKNNNITVIQLDASVNPSNSGGPLIHPYTKEVLGIITRKATGLADRFDDLIASFGSNAEVLKKLQGLSWGGLTIGDVLSVPQDQMKEIAINIKRSANVGIGYAFSCDKLASKLSQ